MIQWLSRSSCFDGIFEGKFYTAQQNLRDWRSLLCSLSTSNVAVHPLFEYHWFVERWQFRILENRRDGNAPLWVNHYIKVRTSKVMFWSMGESMDCNFIGWDISQRGMDLYKKRSRLKKTQKPLEFTSAETGEIEFIFDDPDCRKTKSLFVSNEILSKISEYYRTSMSPPKIWE